MTDTAQSLRLAELLCARLCHDLSSSVGAVAAGTELLVDEAQGGDDDGIAGMVAAAAAAAAARLKFFRAAFGPGSSKQGTAALKRLAEAFLATTPGMALEWPAAEGELPADGARLVLNLIMVARDCLPEGGIITVTSSYDPALGSFSASVVASGRTARMPEEVSKPLIEGRAPENPKGAQASLSRLLAEATNHDLTATPSASAVTLTVVPSF